MTKRFEAGEIALHRPERRKAQVLMAITGMTVAILFGTMGTRSPGVGTIPVSQTLRFVRPVLAGDEITIRLKVLNRDRKKNRVILEMVCLNQKGE